VDTESVPGTIRRSHLDAVPAKEPTNPVLAPGPAGSWDEQHVSGVVRKKEGGGYFSLYRGADSTNLRAVGYAESPDGVNWTKYSGNPVLERTGATTWDERGVGVGSLIDEGDHYTLFFRGYDSSGNFAYGYATSTDLKHWNRRTDPVLTAGPAGGWDQTLYQATFIKSGTQYHAWYIASDASGVTRLGHATSTNGVDWTKDPANPVLDVGGPGSWDDTGIDSFAIIKRSWLGGDYFMVYSAYNSLGEISMGVATSTNGSNWTKYAGNPIATAGGPGSWFDLGVFPLNLRYDGSMYKLTYAGIDGGNKYSTGEAYSLDGLNWLFNFSNPYLSPSPAPAWDDQFALSLSEYLEGNDLRMFYIGIGTSYATGTAACTPSYYAGTAYLDSSVFSVGSKADWGEVTWVAETPPGTNITVKVRCGDTPTPDATWTGWAAVTNGGTVPHADSLYIQYRVEFSGVANATPVLHEIAIDFQALPALWYFAEGYTGPGFQQWLTIQNPNSAAANVGVIYITPSGTPVIKGHVVPAQSRYTILVNSDLGNNLENSCIIESDQPVIVERPMYFRYQGTGGYGWEGGHVSLGTPFLSRHWYFAEGYTGDHFEEWLTVLNPDNVTVTMDITYYVNGADPIKKRHLVPPTSRYTVNVKQDAGPGLEVSVKIEADSTILVERPMYFAFRGSMEGGHTVVGSPYLDQDWYLAEGATFPPFTEYLSIQNPNDAQADITVTYYTNSGPPVARNHTVPARSRYTIDVGLDSGLSAEISTYMHSTRPILVERPMYFSLASGTIPGGHCAMGVNSPSADWYFAEGYTGTGFDEWLTVQNPGGTAAHLTLTYFVQGGTPITKNHTVQPYTRYTIPVDADAGADLQVSVHAHSDRPVIVERPMYFRYQGTGGYGWPGGHDSLGLSP
jgi:P pilus assembly chaperone PapD